VYGAQNRLMTVLMKKGIIKAESIQAGAYFGALEGQILESTNPDINGAKLALINISQFIDEERPYFENTEAIIAKSEKELVHPDKEDSTELGEVPQATEKGSLRHTYVKDPYALNYMYTI
jgi:hypothetical protein